MSEFAGGQEGFNLNDSGGGINLANGPHQYLTTPQQPESNIHQIPFRPNYFHHPQVGGANYHAATGPSNQPPPSPPANVGYSPNFFPMTTNLRPSSYLNMPSSVAPPQRGGAPGFGMGVGAGALAGGALIFGDNFISGFDVPGPSRDASVTLSTYPPF